MAPLLDRYVAENEESKEKQRHFPEAALQASLYATARGVGQGMLEVILAVNEFLSSRVVVAGLSGEGTPPDIAKLNNLIAADLMPAAQEAHSGKNPELKLMKKAIAILRESSDREASESASSQT